MKVIITCCLDFFKGLSTRYILTNYNVGHGEKESVD